MERGCTLPCAKSNLQNERYTEQDDERGPTGIEMTFSSTKFGI